MMELGGVVMVLVVVRVVMVVVVVVVVVVMVVVVVVMVVLVDRMMLEKCEDNIREIMTVTIMMMLELR